ncbi:MAG TPA: MerR family transcriptional regulator [Ignavibacteria bacterium]|nr:MerR family transcriptional regulator [Ignavibacteria bacterium]
MKKLSLKKLYYSISEVSKITGVEQYVLRYWETEFEGLKPQKNRAGNRIYSNKNIKFVLYIKSLLREQKYTIEGAKKILENYSDENELNDAELIGKNNNGNYHYETKINKSYMKKDLEDIKDILELILSKL